VNNLRTGYLTPSVGLMIHNHPEEETWRSTMTT
jgi:hypothetical protein